MGKWAEFDWIEQIRSRQPVDPRVPVGIGDDTAVLAGGGSDWLVTVDMLVEGVHFTSQTPPHLVGRKSMGVNLSDIAAMAGRPVAALVAMGIPPGRGESWVMDLWTGIEEIAREFDVALVGGDTNRSPAGAVISVTLLGQPTGGRAVRRSGAMIGDQILVTGKLGGSLTSGRHLTFSPRVVEAQLLHQAVQIHAMMDLSDGLGSDLFHLARESGCGLVVDEARLPVWPDLPADGRSPVHHALHDGEDFELVLSVSRPDADRLIESPPIRGVPLTVIGEVIPLPGVWLRDENGRCQPLEPGGYVHRWD